MVQSFSKWTQIDQNDVKQSQIAHKLPKILTQNGPMLQCWAIVGQFGALWHILSLEYFEAFWTIWAHFPKTALELILMNKNRNHHLLSYMVHEKHWIILNRSIIRGEKCDYSSYITLDHRVYHIHMVHNLPCYFQHEHQYFLMKLQYLDLISRGGH